jgi:uncharacterized membrane protein YozB (DUF420 family)
LPLGGAALQLIDGPVLLRTRAPFPSDLTLIQICLTAILFTIGWQLARHKRYEAHRWVQTTTATLNAVVVLVIMVNSYLTNILPGIPAGLLEDDYAIRTVHAGVGLMGLLPRIFVVLSGNGLVPDALPFQNHKLFMRTAYTLYLLATLLGIVVYVRGYVLGI